MNWSDALHHLPDHHPRPDLWDRLDRDPRLLDLRADTALDTALRQLPQHDPAPNLWARLAAELTADETLDRALTTLPAFEPKADLWDALESKLSVEPTELTPHSQPTPFTVSRHTGFGQRSVRWAAAASVLLSLLGGYWLYQRTLPAETVTVAYSVETTDAPPPAALSEPASDQQADQDLEVFINQACEQRALACKKPEVQDLRQQLADLDQRKAQIDGQLRVFGEDPDLVKAQVRIENERADVAKELVKILNI